MPASIKILIVEDDQLAKIVYPQLFKHFECSTDIAETGEEAIKKFSGNDYDLILMDIGLPGINGFETTKRIRATAKGKTIPIIGITAIALFCVEEEYKSSSMNDIVAKPLSFETIKELLITYTQIEFAEL